MLKKIIFKKLNNEPSQSPTEIGPSAGPIPPGPPGVNPSPGLPVPPQPETGRRLPASRQRTAGACRRVISHSCCIAIFFLAMVLILMITFVLPRILVPTDPSLTLLLPPGKQELRIPRLLAGGIGDLETVEALLLSLQEPLHIPEMNSVARDLDKSESETTIVIEQTVEVALVECFAAAQRAEKAWIVGPTVYQSLDLVFRGPEGLAKQTLRRLKGPGKIKLERISKIISDEDTTMSEEVKAIEKGLENGKHWFCKDESPRLASLYQRHEGLRQALQGLQRVQSSVEHGAVRELEHYLKRVQATRDAVGGNATTKGGQMRMLCRKVERAVNGY